MDTLRSDSFQCTAVSRMFTSPPAFNARCSSVSQVLRQVGPLPHEALFLGMAEDNLPVLLNLYDATPGPLLIVGSDGWGKTEFLQAVARSIEYTNPRGDVQFGVITNRVEKWQGVLAGSPACIGVFASDSLGAKRFVQSLAVWITRIRDIRESVLVLVDGLDELWNWDARSRDCLSEVLEHGPQKRAWTLATLHPQRSSSVRPWLGSFHLKFFECGLELEKDASELNIPSVIWDTPVEGIWFMMREHERWLRFWVPPLEEG